MRILLCNNFVRHGSGVDAVVRMEEACLRRLGHEVFLFKRDNADFDGAPLGKRLRLLVSTQYSFAVRREVEKALLDKRIDIVHIHNTVPLLTGAIYDACRTQPAVRIVQSIHNYRPHCLSSYSFRNGKSCSLCTSCTFLCCALFACYRKSHLQSLGLVTARWIDSLAGRPLGMTADAFIAVSAFVKRRLVENGIASQAVHVLPNAAPDPFALYPRHVPGQGELARKLVYVGSVAEPKGVFALLNMASIMKDFQFHVVGKGPDMDAFGDEMRRRILSNVIIHGFKDGVDKMTVWSDALFTLIPSKWDEPFPMVAVESLAMGIPVITTGKGGLSDIVEDGVNGLITDFENSELLCRRIRDCWDDHDKHAQMRANARNKYERDHTESAYAGRLTSIFDVVLRGSPTSLQAGPSRAQ